MFQKQEEIQLKQQNQHSINCKFLITQDMKINRKQAQGKVAKAILRKNGSQILLSDIGSKSYSFENRPQSIEQDSATPTKNLSSYIGEDVERILEKIASCPELNEDLHRIEIQICLMSSPIEDSCKTSLSVSRNVTTQKEFHPPHCLLNAL